MKTFRFICLLAIILLGIPGILIAAPAKDTLTSTATQSTNGSNPDGTNGANWVYAYTLPCNGLLSDTLHVELTISNTNSNPGDSYTISFSKSGNTGQIGATLPINFSLSDNSVTAIKDIPITAIGLTPGDYTLNIGVGTPPGALTESNPKNIKVNIHVNECNASVPTCFFTDSSGEFLSDCKEELVSTNEGGTFMLVNKKNGVIVATNPGQFYYNYLWTNDGSGVDVEVQLAGLVNLVPQGANAVHAYTFDTSGFTQSLEAFDMVNNDGTPCGPNGPCTIWVGEDETLWVTWHLAYAGVGLSKPAAGTSCPGSEDIGAAVILVDPSDSLTEIAGECSASATGYNKR